MPLWRAPSLRSPKLSADSALSGFDSPACFSASSSASPRLRVKITLSLPEPTPQIISKQTLNPFPHECRESPDRLESHSLVQCHPERGTFRPRPVGDAQVQGRNLRGSVRPARSTFAIRIRRAYSLGGRGTVFWRKSPDDLRSKLPPCLLETHDKRSEEHTSELQSLRHLVCRLLL